MDIRYQPVPNSLQVWVDNFMLWDISYIYHYIIFTFCFIANDKLDANTAEEYELRTIRGIGPGIASEIDRKRKEREFEDEKDLYNRVKRIPPEAKTKIKVVKKYC